jgi:hypothetical protein
MSVILMPLPDRAARIHRRAGAGVKLAARSRDYRFHLFHAGELDTG